MADQCFVLFLTQRKLLTGLIILNYINCQYIEYSHLVWFLQHMYISHVCCISWNGACSVLFSVLNGVKQGGVISPVLCCIYLNELLEKLAKHELAAILGIFSFALLHTQMILYYWLLWVGLMDLCLVFVIIMR